jgi:amino acid permease
MSYFPIVFGHFAIACAFSIQYSPYAEQSLAVIFYIILALVLVYVNSKRKVKLTRVIWGVMCFLVCFLVMSGLLEVGQSNFNKIRQ